MNTKPVLFSAWLLDLPSFCTDAHLSQVLSSSAVDWQVLHSYGKDRNRTSCFAKVWFPSEEKRAIAINSTMIFHEKRREWSIPALCPICKAEDHQALMCPQRHVRASSKPLAEKSSNSFRSLFNGSSPDQVKNEVVKSTAVIGLGPKEMTELVEGVVFTRMAAQEKLFRDLTNVLVGTVNGVIAAVNQLAQIVALQSGASITSVPQLDLQNIVQPKRGRRTVTIPEEMTDDEFDALLALIKPQEDEDPKNTALEEGEIAEESNDSGKEKEDLSVAEDTTKAEDSKVQLAEQPKLEAAKDIIDSIMRSAPLLDDSKGKKGTRAKTSLLNLAKPAAAAIFKPVKSAADLKSKAAEGVKKSA